MTGLFKLCFPSRNFKKSKKREPNNYEIRKRVLEDQRRNDEKRGAPFLNDFPRLAPEAKMALKESREKLVKEIQDKKVIVELLNKKLDELEKTSKSLIMETNNSEDDISLV